MTTNEKAITAIIVAAFVLLIAPFLLNIYTEGRERNEAEETTVHIDSRAPQRSDLETRLEERKKQKLKEFENQFKKGQKQK